MDLGRRQLGDWIFIPLITENGSGVVTAPHTTGDVAPVGRVFRGLTRVETFRIPLSDSTQTGMFGYWLHLSSTNSYAVGQHFVSMTYSTGSKTYFGSAEHVFEVIPGGDTSGSVVEVQELIRPTSVHIVGEYDIGTVFQGRNPY